MLVKLNRKDRKGKDIYRNAITGVECVLRDHVSSPSIRQARRHMNDRPKVNNRKRHGEMFTQQIVIKKDIGKFVKGILYEATNKVKTVFHYTYSALQRKAAQQRMIHGIA